MNMRAFFLPAFALLAASVSAQAPVLTQPTTSSSIAWTYAPATTEMPLTAINRFEVQTTAAGTWTSVGKALTYQLPALAAGAYAARVRTCPTTATTNCIVSASMPFAVVAAKPTVPAAATVLHIVAGTVPPVVPPVVPPTAGLLFSSGWDQAALGCGAQLLDGVWADYGGSTACDGTVHDADIVSDVHHDGAHSLRITQKPGVSTTADIYNGTDFRVVSRSFGAQSELTLILWVRYDSNYHWAAADHKIALLMGGDSQNVYVNFRGGADPTHPRLCFYPLANDTFFCQASGPYVTVNSWFRVRVHVVTGPHGKVEMFLTPDGSPETPLTLTRDAGTGATVPTDVNTGVVDSIKLDSTFNLGSSITQNMFQYYDSVQVFSGLAP